MEDERFSEEMHRYRAYLTGDAQKIKVFVQIINELKKEMKVDE